MKINKSTNISKELVRGGDNNEKIINMCFNIYTSN